MKSWFTHLELLHSTPGRARFRYRVHFVLQPHVRKLAFALGDIAGVKRTSINKAAHSITLYYETRQTDASSLQAALHGLPIPDVHTAAPMPEGTATMGDPSAVPALAPSLANLVLSPVLAPMLRTPATLAASLPLLKEAWDDLHGKGLTSHVLEAMAVIISVVRQDYLAANTTNFLLALGEYLENSIERKSDEMLKHLLRPASTEIWIERDAQEVRIPACEVRVGDTVIAATGAVIPVDGTVLGGQAMVNEATMTGESVPVARKRGDQVLSGTLLEEGRLRIYAEKIGSDSVAARIAEYVEHSLVVKSNIQLQASQLADQLVPGVLTLAGATWLLSQNWQRVAAVLQADYSCALKLATPVAFKSAMYQGGQNGMLIKGATALEKLAQADTFVFDKTGTLSSGTLKVTDSITFSKDYSPEDLINLAASVEEHYYHPLAMAVVEAAQHLVHQRHFNHKEVEFIVAHGVASVINGKRIVVGSRHFVEDDEGIAVAAHDAAIESLRRQGKTLLYIGFGHKLIGVLALMDEIRSNSAETIERLRKLGARHIMMLTGDHPDRAREVAQALHLDAYHAGLLPAQKAGILQKLSDDGAHIAFIGDGVNDAPALSSAHVGIAMQRGADIARLAADVALLEDDIARVADAKALANATQRLIDTNFDLTVGLNTTILGTAALGMLTPVAASLLHNGSTIAILLRALAGAGLPRSGPAPSAEKKRKNARKTKAKPP